MTGPQIHMWTAYIPQAMHTTYYTVSLEEDDTEEVGTHPAQLEA